MPRQIGHIPQGDISVSAFVHKNIRYVAWEKDGFIFSLYGSENLEADAAALMK